MCTVAALLLCPKPILYCQQVRVVRVVHVTRVVRVVQVRVVRAVQPAGACRAADCAHAFRTSPGARADTHRFLDVISIQFDKSNVF